MDGLHRANLDHCVNIIVTADHGECGTSHTKLGNGILYTDQLTPPPPRVIAKHLVLLYGFRHDEYLLRAWNQASRLHAI